jgi:hypothetical protein
MTAEAMRKFRAWLIVATDADIEHDQTIYATRLASQLRRTKGKQEDNKIADYQQRMKMLNQERETRLLRDEVNGTV